MLYITVATIHPQFVAAYADFGVLRSAVEQKSLAFTALDLRDFAVDRRGSVDDAPYGGGDGMVMRCEPLKNVIETFSEKPYVVLTSPAGKIFKQHDAKNLSESEKPLLFICGRFAGIDQRFIDRYVDVEYSLGDFIVSGGEIPALAMVDATVRHLEGALGNKESVEEDSFTPAMEGGLEYPLYTRPPVFEGLEVPPVLLSGDHEAIKKWRRDQAFALTKLRRPDLLRHR